MARFRIRRLPILKDEYDSQAKPYGLWDTVDRCYVDKYGAEDSTNEYWAVDRSVAVMRRRDLNEYDRMRESA